MEAQQVLATARSGDVPSSWHVWTVRRERLVRSIAGWAVTTLVGFALLIPAAVASTETLPRGGGYAVASVILLALLLVMSFGGFIFLFGDLSRVLRHTEYLLVMTPEDFVRAEPRRTLHVPMTEVRDITMKGVTPPAEHVATAAGEVPTAGPTVLMRMFGQTFLRRTPKVPSSLTFRDQRTDRVVVVATDDTFDELYALDHVLRTYAAQKQRTYSYE